MRLKSVCIIFAASFLVALSGPQNLLAESFSKLMKNADDFMSKGDFKSAIGEYQQALQRESKSVWAQSRLGMAYVQLGDELSKSGDAQGAIDAYKSAVAAEPKEPYSHARLGAALEKKGDHEAAIKEYRTASELSPLDDGLRSKFEQISSGTQGGEDLCKKEAGLRGGAETAPGEIRRAIPLARPDPPYSEWARQARLEGTVVMWIVIDRGGNVACTADIQPLGLGLDAKALETVRKWKFQPAMLNTTPVPVRLKVEVGFKLH